LTVSIAKTRAKHRKQASEVAHLAMETILVLDSSGTRGSLNSLLLGAGYEPRLVTGSVTSDDLLTSDRFSALFLGFQIRSSTSGHSGPKGIQMVLG
jgi:hypothetical protein